MSIGSQMRIIGLRKENVRAWAEVDRLRIEVARLTKDRDYWERIGRDKLDAELTLAYRNTVDGLNKATDRELKTPDA